MGTTTRSRWAKTAKAQYYWVSSFVNRNANFHWKYYSTNLTVDLSEIVGTKSYYHAICANSTVTILKNGGLGTRPPIAQRNMEKFLSVHLSFWFLIRPHQFRSTRSWFSVRLPRSNRPSRRKTLKQNTCSGVFVIDLRLLSIRADVIAGSSRKIFFFLLKKKGDYDVAFRHSMNDTAWDLISISLFLIQL
jgi:hypothetical protein